MLFRFKNKGHSNIKIAKEKVFTGGLFSILLTISYCCRMMSSSWLAFDSNDYLPVFALIMKLFGWVALILGVVYFCRKKHKISFEILPPLLFLAITFFDSNKMFGGQSYVLIVLSIVLFLSFDTHQKSKILTLFYYLVQISIVFSEIIFLSSVLNFTFLYKVESFYKESDAVYHRLLIFAVLKENSGSLRMCGFFNEPGALGTCCIFLLFIFKNRISLYEKIQLIAATILSFSLAGYLLGLIAFSYSLFKKGKIKGLVVLGLLVCLFFMIPKINWGNDTLNAFAARFELSSGKLSGDNRTWWLFDEQVDSVFSGASKYWGFGHDFEIAANSSYLRYFVLYGIYGSLIIFVSWLIAALYKCGFNFSRLVFLALFIVSLYQRPDPLVSLYGYILFFGGVELIGKTHFYKNSNLNSALLRIKMRQEC